MSCDAAEELEGYITTVLSVGVPGVGGAAGVAKVAGLVSATALTAILSVVALEAAYLAAVRENLKHARRASNCKGVVMFHKDPRAGGSPIVVSIPIS